MKRQKRFASERDKRAISDALHSLAHSAACRVFGLESSSDGVPNVHCFVLPFKIAWPTPVHIVVARIHVSSLPLATASYGKHLPARFGMTMAAAGCERIRCQTQIPRHLETEGNGALKSAAHLFYHPLTISGPQTRALLPMAHGSLNLRISGADHTSTTTSSLTKTKGRMTQALCNGLALCFDLSILVLLLFLRLVELGGFLGRCTMTWPDKGPPLWGV